MKKIILVAVFLLLSLIRTSEAHKEWVHQYVAQEAYKLLKNQIDKVPVIANHISTAPDGGGGTWLSSLITTGAWNEDEADLIYNREPVSNSLNISDTSSHAAIEKIDTSDSTYEEPKKSFRRFQVYAGLGLPYGVNIGGKYRISKALFLELETPAVIGIVDGYSSLSFGVSTTDYDQPPGFIFTDGEMAIIFGKFPSADFIAPKSGLGLGLSLRGDLETRFGLSLFIKIGGAKYLSDIYGTGIFETGLSVNF